MGDLSERMTEKSNDKLLADNIHLIQENARLTRDAEGKHRAWQAACEDKARLEKEIVRLNEIIGEQRRLLARAYSVKGDA